MIYIVAFYWCYQLLYCSRDSVPTNLILNWCSGMTKRSIVQHCDISKRVCLTLAVNQVSLVQ